MFQRSTKTMYFIASNQSYKRLYNHSRRKIESKRAAQIMEKLGPLPQIDQSPFSAIQNYTGVYYNVFIGICSASFWRGAWYILDDVLFPNDKVISAISSLMLGTMGMVTVQGLFDRVERYTLNLIQGNKFRPQHTRLSTRSIQQIHSVLRFTAIYSLALSVVCVWRGTWMSWDIIYAKYVNDHSSSNAAREVSADTSPSNESIDSKRIHASDPGHALSSGLMSHCAALVMLCSLGLVASVFAPPAAISIIRDNTIFSTRTNIERILYPCNHAKAIAASNTSIRKSFLIRRSKFSYRWRHTRSDA